jgi:hypothetical protein
MANQSPTPHFTTPKTSDAIISLRKTIEADLENGILNTPSKLRITKLCNAAENAFADRSLLNENQLLFEQNCKRNVRKSVQSRIIGTAKVLSYEDLCEAEKQCDPKSIATRAKSKLNRNLRVSQQNSRKRSRSEELAEAALPILHASTSDPYCSIMSI